MKKKLSNFVFINAAVISSSIFASATIPVEPGLLHNPSNSVASRCEASASPPVYEDLR